MRPASYASSSVELCPQFAILLLIFHCEGTVRMLARHIGRIGYMWLILLATGVLSCGGGKTPARQVNGEILSTKGGVTLVKVWGTHRERGVAQGYLLAERIEDLYGRYILSHFRNRYDAARELLMQGENFTIPLSYLEEAEGAAEGLAAAGVMGIDAWDWLLMNTFLDVTPLLPDFKTSTIGGPGCSTLLSWGNATGRPIATRHLDWGAYPGLIGNDAVIIHLPAEPDEQPWAAVGYAGLNSALSGVNRSGLGGFVHIMVDRTHGEGREGQHYIPFWYALRAGLEKKDFNGDGVCDTRDLQDALLTSEAGAADGFIAALLGPEGSAPVAVIAEITPEEPWHTFRTSAFEDQINGDNLYAANQEIARLDHYNYCVRYAALTSALGDGTGLGEDDCWELMRDHSNPSRLGWDNLQFMQFDPQSGTLRLSVHDPQEGQAWQRPSIMIDLGAVWDLNQP